MSGCASTCSCCCPTTYWLTSMCAPHSLARTVAYASSAYFAAILLCSTSIELRKAHAPVHTKSTVRLLRLQRCLAPPAGTAVSGCL